MGFRVWVWGSGLGFRIWVEDLGFRVAQGPANPEICAAPKPCFRNGQTSLRLRTGQESFRLRIESCLGVRTQTVAIGFWGTLYCRYIRVAGGYFRWTLLPVIAVE